LLDNGLVKKTIVAKQPLGKNVTAAANTHQIIEKLLGASFSMWIMSCQGKVGD
jgi:hypothetical protein